MTHEEFQAINAELEAMSPEQRAQINRDFEAIRAKYARGGYAKGEEVREQESSRDRTLSEILREARAADAVITSLRDRFACAAMQAMLVAESQLRNSRRAQDGDISCLPWGAILAALPEAAYAMADAMLAERAKDLARKPFSSDLSRASPTPSE